MNAVAEIGRLLRSAGSTGACLNTKLGMFEHDASVLDMADVLLLFVDVGVKREPSQFWRFGVGEVVV